MNEGLVAMPSARKPLAGTRPSGDDFIQIVPPVITIRTRPSVLLAAIAGAERGTKRGAKVM